MKRFEAISILLLLFFQVFFALALTTDIISNGSLKKIVVLVSLVIVFLMLLFLAFSINSRTRAIKALVSSAKKLSDGELNINDIVITENNDYRMLAKAFNTMKSNLLFFIENTKKNVITLSGAIVKVTASMNMTCQGNEQVAISIQNIAENSSEQLKLVTDMVSKIKEVHSSSNNISSDIHAIEEEASETTAVSRQGRDELDFYEQSMVIMSESMMGTKEFISRLRDSISEISNVNMFILEISEQLKLLSLNAAIEASRSGETGRGFSVVANEITNLSETTRKEIGKTNTIISTLLKNGINLENSIKKSLEDFEKGRNVFSEVKEVFSDIMSRNVRILGNINHVTEEAKKIKCVVEDTSTLSQNVFNSSSLISHSTTEVAAATEEMNAEFTEINQIVASLQNFVQDIDKLTAIFKIGIRPVEASSSKQLRIGFILPKTGLELWNLVGEGAAYALKELSSKNTIVEMIEVSSAGNGLLSNYFDALNKCAEKNYDGLCLVGFDNKYIPVVNSLVNNGTEVMLFNTDFSEECRRLGCVLPNENQSGIVAAESMLRYLNGKGRVLIIDNEVNNNAVPLRNSGFTEHINKSGNIKLLPRLTLSGNASSDEIVKVLTEYLKQNSDIDGIFFSSRFKLLIAKVIEELNLTGKVKLIVYGIDRETCNYIKKGVITCGLGQDPFGQGHDSIACLYNYLITRQKPENETIWAKCDIVDTENVHFLLN